jgi:hypothetical protein
LPDEIHKATRLVLQSVIIELSGMDYGDIRPVILEGTP